MATTQFELAFDSIGSTTRQTSYKKIKNLVHTHVMYSRWTASIPSLPPLPLPIAQYLHTTTGVDGATAASAATSTTALAGILCAGRRHTERWSEWAPADLGAATAKATASSTTTTP